MSPTIRTLVIPVSDLEAPRPSTRRCSMRRIRMRRTTSGTTSTASRSAWLPTTRLAGPWPTPTSRISTRPAQPPRGWCDRAQCPTSSRAQGAGLRARRHRRQPDRPTRPVVVVGAATIREGELNDAASSRKPTATRSDVPSQVTSVRRGSTVRPAGSGPGVRSPAAGVASHLHERAALRSHVRASNGHWQASRVRPGPCNGG